jgi:2-polyprenyl-3-methyl-5-hydroxy-6-metoxy-1,4-benzoquinol methylase
VINVVETSKEYWEEYWEKEQRKTESSFLFQKLLDGFDLNIDSYFEFGCAPGTNMAYFSRKYDCSVEGVDFVDKRIIEHTLKDLKVKNFKVYQADVYDFETDKKYDFVGSYGFIEHFGDPETIIKKHKDLVNPGGYLCIEIPNFRYVNYLINKHFSEDILEKHNLSIMDLKLLKKLILDDEFTELYANYYLTSYFQANSESGRLKAHPTIEKVYNAANKTMEGLKLDNIPNKYLSPYIFVLAKKKSNVK